MRSPSPSVYDQQQQQHGDDSSAKGFSSRICLFLSRLRAGRGAWVEAKGGKEGQPLLVSPLSLASVAIPSPISPAAQKKLAAFVGPMAVRRSGGLMWALLDRLVAFVGLLSAGLFLLSLCAIAFGGAGTAASGAAMLDGYYYHGGGAERRSQSAVISEGGDSASTLSDAGNGKGAGFGGDVRSRLRKGQALIGKAAVRALAEVASTIKRARARIKKRGGGSGDAAAAPLGGGADGDDGEGSNHSLAAAEDKHEGVSAGAYALYSGIVGRDALMAAIRKKAAQVSARRSRDREITLSAQKAAGAVDPYAVEPRVASSIEANLAAAGYPADAADMSLDTYIGGDDNNDEEEEEADEKAAAIGGSNGTAAPEEALARRRRRQQRRRERQQRQRRQQKERQSARRAVLASSLAYPYHSRDALSNTAQTVEERDNFDNDATFFVSIAQFMDVLCPQTIMELYRRARNPRRIFAGIVDQRYPQRDIVPNTGRWLGRRQPITFGGSSAVDHTCMPWYMMHGERHVGAEPISAYNSHPYSYTGKIVDNSGGGERRRRRGGAHHGYGFLATPEGCATADFCPTDNIRVRHSLPIESKGPTWGRAVGMLMYQGEHFFMMIDSHSRFVNGWDFQIILNLNMAGTRSKRPILSHYPGVYEREDELMNPRKEDFAMMMCFASYLKDIGIIRMTSQSFMYTGHPTIQPFSAGGFVVGNAQFVHEVPFDPHLTYVFDGEEILYSARLWTHGYDLFTPRNNILFHHYARHDSPKYWSASLFESSRPQLLRGQARVRYLMQAIVRNSTTRERSVSPAAARSLGVDVDEHLYGMGSVRSLDEYYTFAGIDPVYWIVKFAFCHNMTTFINTPMRYQPRGWTVERPDAV